MRATAIAAFLLAPAITAAQAPSYTKDIVPLFEARCLGCHAELVRMGSLNMSSFEGLMQGGTYGPIVAPGRRAESKLYLILTGQAAPLMPMDGTRLTEAQIDLVGRWIDAGAINDTPAGASAGRRDEPPDIKPRAAVKPQVFAMAWHPKGASIALAGYKEVRLADPRTGGTSATFTGHADTVRNVAFSPDGRLLAAAGGLPGKRGEVKIWNVEKQEAAVTISGHDDCIYGLAFAPDGKTLATASYDKLIKLWDTATGKEIRTLKDHIDAVYALAFTPDGSRLISGSADRGVKVWNPSTGERLYTMSEPLDGVNTVAVDPTGKIVAAGGLDKSIRLWRLGEREGTILTSLMAHEDAILKLAFSPDGKYLASSSADRTLKIFEVPDLREIQLLTQSDWAYGVEYSPDGKSLAAGRFDGTLSLYDSAQYRDALEKRLATR